MNSCRCGFAIVGVCRRSVVASASPRHQTSYLYVKAGAAKSSNVRRALRTVDGRGNRNAWVDGGECSAVRAVRVSLKARAAKPPSRERRDRASAKRPLHVSAGPAAPIAPRFENHSLTYYIVDSWTVVHNYIYCINNLLLFPVGQQYQWKRSLLLYKSGKFYFKTLSIIYCA